MKKTLLTKDKFEIRRLKQALAIYGGEIVELKERLERANKFIKMCLEQIKNLKSRTK